MTIKNREIASCNLWVQLQILYDSKRIFHLGSLPNITHKAVVVPHHFEL